MEWVNPATLGDNPANWRRHPESQMAALADVLADESVGWAGVLLFNETTGHLIDGHARKAAAIAAGDLAVPVVIGSWTIEAEKKILLTLDPIAGMASIDTVQLNTLIDEVDLGDAFKDMIDGLADSIKDAEQAAAASVEVTEDEVPDAATVAPRCKPGDLWQLGEQRLLCGDSTKAADVGRLMNGEKAALVFADPPYGYSYQSNQRTKSAKFDVLINDDTILDGFIPLLGLASDGWALVCTSWKVLGQWMEVCEPLGELTNLIVWDKGGGGMGDLEGTLATDHELILAYGRGGKIQGKRIGSVWSVGKDAAGSYQHATQKPVGLAAMAMDCFTVSTDAVYDPFLGSGTTLIAAEQLHRRCYGIEISPKYCDIILARWEKLTGKTAELQA